MGGGSGLSTVCAADPCTVLRAFFSGDAQEFFYVGVRTLLCAYSVHYICIQFVCPNPLIFLPLFISLLLFLFRRVVTWGQQTTDMEVCEHRVQ